MSYCDDCIHSEVCGVEDAGDEALKFCADKLTKEVGHCKDCKWWKDSDGAFRRGIGAESQCPMNRIEVYEGNGYCFLFEPQEGSEKG